MLPAAPSSADLLPARHLARRIVCVHLPRLSVERWQRVMERQGEPLPDDLPAVLVTEGPHGPVVHGTTRAAEAIGIRVGARVVDMQALCPGLKVEYADTGGDELALQNLMIWARRWCPWTATCGTDGLMLDTSGSAHLFGGEAALLKDIEGNFSRLGLTAALSLAPTQGAAWALARFGPVRPVVSPENLAQALGPLPIRALRLKEDVRLTLHRLGLKTVAALAEVPRSALRRRFVGADPFGDPLLRLDQAFGRAPEPVEPSEEPPRFAVDARLAEPVQDPVPHLPQLCEDLAEALGTEGYGARMVELSVYRTDGEVRRLQAITALPSRDPEHLSRLFDGKLEQIDPGFGFDLITLTAPVAEDLSEVQTRLEGGDDTSVALARLIDRLSARLGADRVLTPSPRARHIPERAEGWVPAIGQVPEPLEALDVARPLRLLSPPEEVRVMYAVPEGPPAQFTWRRQLSRVARFTGPERIAPEWWQDHPGARLRDYYRIEDAGGRRLWMYREGIEGDGRGGGPRWFVHGVFA